MTRRVIIHADDFGLHRSVDTAIRLGHERGVISSASILIEGAAAKEAIDIARALPSLDLGLHFTLTGREGGLTRFFADWVRGKMRRADVTAALHRQLGMALRTQRLTLSHIDSHQHLHALPPIMDAVCRAAKDCDIRCVRVPEDGPAFARVPPSRRAQSAALRVCARLSRRIVARYGLTTTDHFSGMAVSGHLTRPTLADYIARAKPGTTEIVCHPGTDNKALSRLYTWQYDWQEELVAVQSAEARTALSDLGISLVGWRDF